MDDLPTGAGYQYEQKYDGFRCLAFRKSDPVQLQSKNQKSLARYFPEIESALQEVDETGFVLDGEIISPEGIETLQLRLHPAASRVEQMSIEHPARYIVFDILARLGSSLMSSPLEERRAVLEESWQLIRACLCWSCERRPRRPPPLASGSDRRGSTA
ncbi:hypothetical protein [Citreimonas salinaria]|uniref:ATP-dependent DNA ligase n=1 Tax=Citreimonas salinaria TaxID=321339 RepID=UPI0015A5165C|nr:hypothetical protein [Citreimonas salinaria]